MEDTRAYSAVWITAITSLARADGASLQGDEDLVGGGEPGRSEPVEDELDGYIRVFHRCSQPTVTSPHMAGFRWDTAETTARTLTVAPGSQAVRTLRAPGSDVGRPPRHDLELEVTYCVARVHLTEACEPYAPHLITDVVTTPATVQDVEVTAGVHARLGSRGLLPQEHLADTAYVDAHLLVSAASEHGVDLIGPVRADTSWQAAHDGYTVADFAIDWQQHRLTCPNGNISSPWRTITKRGTPVIRVQFSATDCIPCPLRSRCTRHARYRELTLRPQAQHDALVRRRREQITDAWKERYAARQGVEGTIGQAVNAYQLRRCRYRGLAKTRLQHELTACAINLVRIGAWRDGIPLAPTRTSHFAALLYRA